ncbi:hypothetical protein [Clostridium coskatii]|uniref:Uncharacterized protein n=1 Tax=Clostridium coskatii TaxID=1705578 RepID=A0A166RHM9_9CLOT|nr:hypothetical protein [Clostridium coskatii]OAA90814.1 hypothetical protein WX73_01964 [Clostridium coskatii]OBR96848.1 hypothetical protein CLCOS_06920 [Clostridium coskatii]
MNLYKLTRKILDRKTGKLVSSQIIENVDMSEEEYYKPIVESVTKKIMNDLIKAGDTK